MEQLSSVIVETWPDYSDLQSVAKKMPVIVIYDKPKDFPDKFVARLFDLDQATRIAMLGDSIHHLREQLPYGLIRMLPQVDDEPHIVELWI